MNSQKNKIDFLESKKINFNVCFVGLDGAGKGTYIDLLLKDYKKANTNYKLCYLGHGSQHLLLVKKIVSIKDSMTSKGMAYKLMLLLYFLFLPLDLLLRRGFTKYDIVISDRHPRYEPIVENGIFKVYDKLINHICPKPNLVIYLTGPTKALWERKKEYPYDKYVHKKENLDALIERNKNQFLTVQIDTSIGIAKVYNKIKALLNLNG
jgi:thymidylate kinase